MSFSVYIVMCMWLTCYDICSVFYVTQHWKWHRHSAWSCYSYLVSCVIIASGCLLSKRHCALLFDYTIFHESAKLRLESCYCLGECGLHQTGIIRVISEEEWERVCVLLIIQVKSENWLSDWRMIKGLVSGYLCNVHTGDIIDTGCTCACHTQNRA